MRRMAKYYTLLICHWTCNSSTRQQLCLSALFSYNYYNSSAMPPFASFLQTMSECMWRHSIMQPAGISSPAPTTAADAFVVVYSVEDRRSFEAAIDCLCDIRESLGEQVPIIIVANKTDLVRKRLVNDEGNKRINSSLFISCTGRQRSSSSLFLHSNDRERATMWHHKPRNDLGQYIAEVKQKT